MKNTFCKIKDLAWNHPATERGALTIEWGQIIAIIVVVLLAVGALLQVFIPNFFASILAKLGS